MIRRMVSMMVMMGSRSPLQNTFRISNTAMRMLRIWIRNEKNASMASRTGSKKSGISNEIVCQVPIMPCSCGPCSGFGT
jgi:hypothetical protein